MMNDKILIDTNILVYSTDKKHSFYEKSIKIIFENMENICIATKNISEFVAVLTKLDIDYKIILNHLKMIKEKFKVLYPDDKSINILYALLEKYTPKGNRIFDMEIVSVMLANDVNKIATMNIKDFEKIEEIEIV